MAGSFLPELYALFLHFLFMGIKTLPPLRGYEAREKDVGNEGAH